VGWCCQGRGVFPGFGSRLSTTYGRRKFVAEVPGQCWSGVTRLASKFLSLVLIALQYLDLEVVVVAGGPVEEQVKGVTARDSPGKPG
jgi:hypothetical protein